MKPIVAILLLCVLGTGARADVLIEYRGITGATGTMLSNGERVRINGVQMPGYLLVDGASGEFFMVDPQRNEIIRVAPGVHHPAQLLGQIGEPPATAPIQEFFGRGAAQDFVKQDEILDL